MHDNVFICKECGCSFASADPIGLHLARKHKMSIKEYYDKYFRKPGEGICLTCGKETKFLKLSLGYRTYCSKACVSNNKEIQARKSQTCLSHFGVKNPAQAAEVQEKIKEYNIHKYGTERPTQSAQIKEKTKLTNFERYGSHPSKTDDVKRTMKETMFNRYGVEYACQMKDFYEKRERTCLTKYGVKHPMQNHEIFCKARHKFEHDGKRFDSTWEIELYDFLKEQHADFIYQPDVFFEYEYDGKTHRYHPDFLIEGQYTEIKGLQFFENKDPNGKMINPFDRSGDGCIEAKHQCMIKNGIKIITNIEDYKKEWQNEHFNFQNDDC